MSRHTKGPGITRPVSSCPTFWATPLFETRGRLRLQLQACTQPTFLLLDIFLGFGSRLGDSQCLALFGPLQQPRSHPALDLDQFKIHNDTKGYDVGDMLLIEAAHRLLASVRAGRQGVSRTKFHLRLPRFNG
ncbi:diguanylate cyclase domain-containing protein [Candidatus Reidiella endopervernicosa]|uniref:diguanylate cyclase domain-containing protein n=1 Tax=Candidatus Reidiella endopervernicosa TaxID=2738883 RepID=UPI002A4E13D3|nr:diguanylate cyclase [Candidatus Reidiella endopervernicosa]